MGNTKNWDWETSEKVIDTNLWNSEYNWVEEPCVSPDGETIASIVNIDEDEFNICINGETREMHSEKLWHLRFTPDNRLTALVSIDGEWTLDVDGIPWENRFDYAWNPLFSNDGSHIAIAAQSDMKYRMVLDDAPWDSAFVGMSHFTLGAGGNATAAAVQTKEFKQADVKTFQEGCYTAALNGEKWDTDYLNVWNMVISPDGKKLAAEVRLNLYDYTIVENGVLWASTYSGVWAPVINPVTGIVAAPVRSEGKWAMAENGTMIWERPFNQIMNQIFSPDGNRLAAIVSPEFGKWTVAVDGTPWNLMVTDMITDLVFSPNGKKTAAVMKNNDHWFIAVDGDLWEGGYDMVWKPVFSPDNRHVAAKVEKNGKYTIVLNGHVWKMKFDEIWPPVFDDSGENMLIRCMENGNYYRRIIPVKDIQTR